MKVLLSPLLSLFFILFSKADVNSQVWNGDLTFSSQAQIDDFTAASYTIVNGTLKIEDGLDNQQDIRNLAGLASIDSVNGPVYIRNNNLLLNTDYLNLRSVGSVAITDNIGLITISNFSVVRCEDVSIVRNANLKRITGFNQLTGIRQFSISSNPLLNDISGFISLTKVTSVMSLSNNNSLTELGNFSNLHECNSLTITNNPALVNIDGLAGLTSLGQLTINNNPHLVNADGLANLTSVTNSIDIGNNNLLQNLAGLSMIKTFPVSYTYIHDNNSLVNIDLPAGTHSGTIMIHKNPALTTIGGFSNLTRSGTIEIHQNAALQTISGFNNLDTIAGSFSLYHNEVLTTINGFSKLKHVAGDMKNIGNYDLGNISPMPLLIDIGGIFEINTDTVLTNLDFIPNLQHAGSLKIAAFKLGNLNGLSHISSVTFDIGIFCDSAKSIEPLSGLSTIPGNLTLQIRGLLNLKGLENITSIGESLQIGAASQITNLDELINLDSVGLNLVIVYNQHLQNLNGLRHLRYAGLVYINNNTSLNQFCGLYPLYANGGHSGGTIISQNLVNPTPQQILNAGECSSVILPVLFKVLNLKCENGKVIFNWITTQENNNSHFIVQRSSDGIDWMGLGKIPASGNNGGESTYSFTDISPLVNGLYRLAQYDLDGRVNYSSVLKQHCENNDFINLWPNPVNDKLFLSVNTNRPSKAVIRLYSSNGALVKIQHAVLLNGTTQIEINMNNYPSGIYHLSMEWNEGMMTKNFSLIKQ